jgi:hypothetical protein
MDVKKLLGMRPKTQSAADIQAAILRAQEGQRAALRRATEIEKGRGLLLLNGDPAAVEAGERELVESRAEAERYALLASTLEAPLRAAQTKERAAKIQATAKEAQTLVDAFVEFWRTRYPGLAAQLWDGALMEKRALDKLDELANLAGNDHEAFEAAGIAAPASPAQVIYPDDPSNTMSGVLQRMKLPSPDRREWPQGNASSFWPIDAREALRG